MAGNEYTGRGAEPAAASPLRDDPYAAHHGIHIVSAQRGLAQVRIELPPWARNAAGVCHGGVLFTLADYAAGVANHTIGRELSMQGNINWLGSAAPGDVLTAEARVVHEGRRTFVTSVEVRNQHGRRVAWATFTGARLADGGETADG
ncbi:MAG: PaaI family thioesterase [Chloroflexi bacterium]|nr:PaaI family thioesterase [Chloroflexota bacterium]MBI4506515.1 PaaI family thioesterase [Chloroflexota bacterium]